MLLWHLDLTAVFPSRSKVPKLLLIRWSRVSKGIFGPQLAAPNISLPGTPIRSDWDRWTCLYLSSDNNGDRSWHAANKATKSFSFSSLSFVEVHTDTCCFTHTTKELLSSPILIVKSATSPSRPERNSGKCGPEWLWNAEGRVRHLPPPPGPRYTRDSCAPTA